MQYAISAGAIVLREGQLLLVHHRADSYDFWVPPGGRLRGEESIFDCAARETLEETGLQITPERVLYIEEFVQPELHFCKFWVIAQDAGGRLSVEGLDTDEARAAVARSESGDVHVVDARFFSRDAVRTLAVYPRVLRDVFWEEDLAQGFAQTRYLGLQHIEDD
jgi:ADP-ribose pyrophosphatase YjhB (NUDIX family)